MKTKDSILQRMKELVDEMEQMETAQSQFQTGDMVSFADEGVDYVGQIEAYDDDTMTVRVYAMAGDDLEPTDDVRTIPYESAGKYPKSDNEETPEQEDENPEPEGDTDPDEEKSVKEGLWVGWVSKAGTVKGIVQHIENGKCQVEVYEQVKDLHEPTNVIIEHELKDVTLCDRQDYEIKPQRIMAKMSDFEIAMGDEEKQVGSIEGLASTYGNVDLGGDVVTKGAFTQTLMHKDGKVKMYFDHSYRVKDIAGIAYLEDSDKGLVLKGEMPLGVTDVKEGYEKIKFLADRGERMGLSIGYDVVKSRMTQNGIRELKEIALHEVSITPFPMNTEAVIYSAKARKLGYQARKSAWQTIVSKTKSDAPTEGNQLTQGDIKSLVDEIATFISTPTTNDN